MKASSPSSLTLAPFSTHSQLPFSTHSHTGYHHINLMSTNGKPLPQATIFVYIEIQDIASHEVSTGVHNVCSECMQIVN